MSMSRLSALSTFTGLSEAELQRRADSMGAVATHRVQVLSSLDAALAQGSTSSAAAAQDAYAALSATSLQPHAIEDPVHAYARSDDASGFAPSERVPASAGDLDKAARRALVKLSGFTTTTDTDSTTTSTTTSETSETTDSTDSTNIEFEQLKNEMNKLSQIQTAMSAVLSATHTSAMTIINNIKG